MMAPGYAEAISTPVLLCAAGKDRIVDVTAEQEFVKRLPKGELFDMPDAEHEILMESDAIRTRFWDAFDAFARQVRLGLSFRRLSSVAKTDSAQLVPIALTDPNDIVVAGLLSDADLACVHFQADAQAVAFRKSQS